MTYTIEYCGPSKDYFLTPEITLTTNMDLNPLELKNLLLTNISQGANELEAQSMLDSCLLASEQKVLDNHQVVPRNERLFLLPPVCGG